MLGIDRPPVVIDEMLVPPEANGVRCISMGFFAARTSRSSGAGPMLHKALEQFLTDVYWDEPDYLVVDMPPGTGDISLSLAQFLPRAEVYVVTTPQPAAQKVAQRAGVHGREGATSRSRASSRTCRGSPATTASATSCSARGGGQELAERLDVPLLGQVPLVPALREGGDDGRPIVAVDPDSEAAQVFRAMAERVDVELAPTRASTAAS